VPTLVPNYALNGDTYLQADHGSDPDIAQVGSMQDFWRIKASSGFLAVEHSG
jgi:hypothetical protein